MGFLYRMFIYGYTHVQVFMLPYSLPRSECNCLHSHILSMLEIFFVSIYPVDWGAMACKKLRRARLSQELCERLSRHQITTCQVRELFIFVMAGFGGGC